MNKQEINVEEFRKKVQDYFDKALKVESDTHISFNSICAKMGFRSQTISRFLDSTTSPTIANCEKMDRFMSENPVG